MSGLPGACCTVGCCGNEGRREGGREVPPELLPTPNAVKIETSGGKPLVLRRLVFA